MTKNINGVELEYEFKTDKSTGRMSIVIVGASDIQGDFTIPAAIDGYVVTHIGDSAFYHCIGLTRVIIPDGVTKIARNAFAGCRELKSVEISATVMDIGYHAFDDCGELRSFSVAEDNPNYKSVSRLLLTKDGKTLVFGVNGDVTIPDGVTRIGSGAFSSCYLLTSVKIQDSVTSIGDGAFFQCYALSDVTIPDSVVSIGNGAFHSCRGLTNVVIHDSVTSIGGSAFYGCVRLRNVVIPNSVTSIGALAFYDCGSLANVTIPTGVTSLGCVAFASTALETVFEVGDTDRVKKMLLDSGLDIKGIKFLELKMRDT